MLISALCVCSLYALCVCVVFSSFFFCWYDSPCVFRQSDIYDSRIVAYSSRNNDVADSWFEADFDASAWHLPDRSYSGFSCAGCIATNDGASKIWAVGDFAYSW